MEDKQKNELESHSFKKVDATPLDHFQSPFIRVSGHIESARQNIQRAINIEMIYAYWRLGREIIIEEEQGLARSEYDEAILRVLSGKLTQEYGHGFGVDNLARARKFYLTYPRGSLEEGSLEEKSATVSQKFIVPIFHPNLSWSHYVQLIRISRPEARAFYANEASKNNWSTRELQRQVGSLLFDRLAKSENKEGFIRLAYQDQEINRPEEAMKDPDILEFLGIPESHRLVDPNRGESFINDLKQS